MNNFTDADVLNLRGHHKPCGLLVTFHLNILSYRVFDERCRAHTNEFSTSLYTTYSLMSLRRLAKRYTVPDLSMVIGFGDGCKHMPGPAPLQMYSTSSSCTYTNAFPIYDWYWPGANGFQGEYRFDSIPLRHWDQRIAKLFWVGARSNAKRDAIVHYGTVRANDTDIAWTNTHFKDVAYASQYKYILDVDGYGCTFRLKNMFLSGAVIFKIKSDVHEYWWSHVSAWKHYIPVDDTSVPSLDQALNWAKHNDGASRQIALNALHFARSHLTFDKMHQYQLNYLTKYAQHQKGGIAKSLALTSVS